MVRFWGPKLDPFLESLLKNNKDLIMGPKTGPIFGAKNWPPIVRFLLPPGAQNSSTLSVETTSYYYNRLATIATKMTELRSPIQALQPAT